MSKSWLLLTSVAFGVGFSLSLPFSRDLKQSALAGLLTVPAASAGAWAVSQQQKRSLGQSFSSLQQEIESLIQQKATLQQSIQQATLEKQNIQIQLEELQNSLQQLEEELVAQRKVKQTLGQEVSTSEAQKLALDQESHRLQTWIDDMREREQHLNQSVSAITVEKEQLQADVERLTTELNATHIQLAEQQGQQGLLGNLVADLEERRSQLECELTELSDRIQEAEQQERNLNQSLARIATQNQKLEAELSTLQFTLQGLTAQVLEQQQLQAHLEQEIVRQQAERKAIEVAIASLQASSKELETILASQQNQRDQLNRELAGLISERNQLQQELQQLQTLIEAEQRRLVEIAESSINQSPSPENVSISSEQVVEPEIISTSDTTSAQQPENQPVPPENLSAPPLSIPEALRRESVSASQPTPRPQPNFRPSGDYNFARSQHARHLWEQKLLPYWTHRDRPNGQRFLGSLKIKREATDAVLDIVGQNLRRLDHLTVNSLYERFDDADQNQDWLKVLTFAFSEYAYYYSEDRFWQGFCEKLGLYHNQGVENTFRHTVEEGIDLLGLVKAKGGYRYVSTLWLQSGIPEQNLEHFAQLVQELADEYGWWEISHTNAPDLAQELLHFCQQRHSQWGTLKNFLKASCPQENAPNDTGAVDPISGHLVQGIAVVAQELERQGLAPEALLDDNQREDLLKSYYLPNNFFLRSWSALMRVLTPKERSTGDRKIASHRQRSLLLELDPSSFDTQLFLPQQTLWKPNWRNLRGTFCQISEANWESTIPTTGSLEIPELAIRVKAAEKTWTCTLKNHNRNDLLQWNYAGVLPELPCLIFDATTGEHIPVRATDPIVTGTTEILCFTPKEVQLELGDGVELVERNVPSSIRGWRGQSLELVTLASTVNLKSTGSESTTRIHWQGASADQPMLQGIRLRGKKAIYLEAPTFWHPPIHQEVNLNVLIENLDLREVAGKSLETLAVCDRWQPISLDRWIDEPGVYEARFWNDLHRWSYRFEVKPQYELSSPLEPLNLQISSFKGEVLDIPLQVETPEEFWATTLQISGLWTLERVMLILSNGQDEITYPAQADTVGTLEVRVSALYDLLGDTGMYRLNYQRDGEEPNRLVEWTTTSLGLEWADRHLVIRGLSSGHGYLLHCWNLLCPNERFNTLEVPAGKTAQIPLNLPPGIYHLQLFQNQQLVANLGWWCDDTQDALLSVVPEDEHLANYWYTIIGNEPISDFLEAATAIQLDLSLERLNILIADLTSSYHFLAWLNRTAILEKLQALQKDLQAQNSLLPAKPLPNTQTPPVKPMNSSSLSNTALSEGAWYLVTVTSWGRDLFCDQLENLLGQSADSQTGILNFRKGQGAAYAEYVLLQVANIGLARNCVKGLPHFRRIENRPLRVPDVQRMIGD